VIAAPVRRRISDTVISSFCNALFISIATTRLVARHALGNQLLCALRRFVRDLIGARDVQIGFRHQAHS